MTNESSVLPVSTATGRISPVEVARLLQADPGSVRLLDVRTPGEYSTAHIPGSYNVPIDVLPEHAPEIRSLQTPVVLICQSGQRADRADAVLRTSGMRQLRVLDGGMRGWLAVGLPVNRGHERMSLERQVRIAAGLLSATGAFLALLMSPWFAAIPAFVGSGLVFSGVTDTCTMGMLLARLPYNRASVCDVAIVVQALRAGQSVESAGSTTGRTSVGCCR
jgi:rhodanese-related sulfurtransferase